MALYKHTAGQTQYYVLCGHIHSIIVCVCVCAHNAPIGGLSEQSSEGDDRGHAGAVEEQEGGDTLQINAVSIVTQVERNLPLDVQNQTSKQPNQEERQGSCMTAESSRVCVEERAAECV